jgi:8-oxo-dGTP diphosphatase
MEKRNYNETALFERKNHFCGYIFCPLCGNKLSQEFNDGRPRLKCQNNTCDFIFYQNPAPAAGALVIENNKILLVKRAHHPKRGWWGLPAGFIEWEEHPEQTAIREVAEETGYQIKLDSFFGVYSGNDDPRTNALLILYIASIGGGQLRAGDDADEARFFDFDALPENIAFISNRQALADYKEKYLK